MDHSVHNKLISFIWNIADDCLRDVYVRGKYRDVILPMVVLRRLDTLLEPTKEAVLAEVKFQKEEMQATELDDEPLKSASGYVFYNTSKWTLKSLFSTATNNQQILLANFEEYLLGFSDNVKEIVECFNLKSQIRHMASKQVLLDVVEKFVSPYINLTPEIVEDPDGNKMPALTNLGMGYVFEELIRKFNEENNEEAGEHFTPREVIELMTHLVFDPVKDQLPLTMTVYDPACGSGGMLTESQNFIEEKYPNDNRDIYLYGKEINDETYAICKSDMMIKGNNPENIKVGSTLSTDEFASSRFDFMLSNPPYGKSWASEQKHIKDGSDVIDPRFKVSLKDYWGNVEVVDATPRSSDGQLLFLMEMVNKMKDPSVSLLGSRIASVHNGSSLFTGDAGGGESNIRRFIIENDMLDAIVQLPNNLFYNTGITTYIWVLNNNKLASRKGKVQLIDASLLYRKLRKNLGNKNCEFAPEHITEITDTYLSCLDVERQLDTNNNPIGIASKVFSNDDFGYYKVTIERPDRRKARFTQDAIAALRFDKQFSDVMTHLYAEYGDNVYKNTGFGSDQKKSFLKSIEKEIFAWCEENEIRLNAKARTKLLDVKHWLALRTVLETAQKLMSDIGHNEFDDFNEFTSLVDKSLKVSGVRLSTSEKNAILNAVSWYDESAKKVVKKVVKLSGDKLDDLLDRYECEEDDLPDFGFYPSGKKGEYITYETNADLRDSESVPLKQSIYQYFLDEVKPHVNEAWINLDSVKIGYEINFNKYFYLHKPLRSLEEVATDIINLEHKADGVIAQVLGIKSLDVNMPEIQREY
ncbi:type I restriction-modification system subunit M [Enterobacter asburiae]|uniref:type I restriction-modification system subunit M n=3 Tax=Enterobacteriaceae TaxID=543 RepID=UPI0005DB3873|nr:class I SAM-dependent DNA methyltransferase [Enterobacter asburiae]KJI88623.1 DNA methylase [Enterobacter asburiae]MDV5191268.1 class I SAM-dependent DNA methyltransferase [Enterobacter asburiae]MDV5267470.1 class I SAM-dependent DNA methyltransferase [Enterobacter asburiae]OAZ89905.1 DNA methylase [Enterobacter asburiae]RUN94878.1 SAM-dependent DNA methyltransferase [Enterobacter asburiae]